MDILIAFQTEYMSFYNFSLSDCYSRYLNGQPVEAGLRFHTDIRKSYADVVYSLSIDNTEVEDTGEVKAIAQNKAGEAVTIAKLIVEGSIANRF